MEKKKSLFGSLIATALLSLIWAMSAMFISFENFSWQNPDQIYLMVITAVASSSALNTIVIMLLKLPGIKQLHQKHLNKKEAKRQGKIELTKEKYIAKKKSKEELKKEKNNK